MDRVNFDPAQHPRYGPDDDPHDRNPFLPPYLSFEEVQYAEMYKKESKLIGEVFLSVYDHVAATNSKTEWTEMNEGFVVHNILEKWMKVEGEGKVTTTGLQLFRTSILEALTNVAGDDKPCKAVVETLRLDLLEYIKYAREEYKLRASAVRIDIENGWTGPVDTLLMQAKLELDLLRSAMKRLNAVRQDIRGDM